MSEKDGVSVHYRRQGRIISKVVITYRLEDEPKNTERTWTLEHGGDGDIIDGIIWNDGLMKKLAYLEQDECRKAEKRPGKGDWKRYTAGGEAQQMRPLMKESEMEVQADTTKADTTKSDTKPDMTNADMTMMRSIGSGDCVWLHDVDCWWSEYCIDSPI